MSKTMTQSKIEEIEEQVVKKTDGYIINVGYLPIANEAEEMHSECIRKFKEEEERITQNYREIFEPLLKIIDDENSSEADKENAADQISEIYNEYTEEVEEAKEDVSEDEYWNPEFEYDLYTGEGCQITEIATQIEIADEFDITEFKEEILNSVKQNFSDFLTQEIAQKIAGLRLKAIFEEKSEAYYDNNIDALLESFI